MRAIAVLAALALAMPAKANDFSALGPTERAALDAELRAAILASGDVIADALAGPQPAQSEMQQYIQDDLSLLERLAPNLLEGHAVALFTSPDCSTCTAAISELKGLSMRYGTTFILHDLSAPQAAEWAKALGLSEAPFYVLPDMVLKGHMPAVVLARYLTR
ncbi:hypothetical protein OIHEL45_11805 [Sulfitobacter indolifex HEL-45]|uniref:Uncharacterized protein n=1 Tax=Sulfitobacter indolifex HEL-45 TaxID=391624 RepID=A0ABM9X3K0_9RHOB|nr:hypothetical protein [Sulfitobacter indolifex]EDQ04017.1 hypothetical protein OIHEL45_11805 [Sulfitobacter indolifex HEL-45]